MGREIEKSKIGCEDGLDVGSEKEQGSKDDSQFFSLNNWANMFLEAEDAGIGRGPAGGGWRSGENSKFYFGRVTFMMPHRDAGQVAGCQSLE